jgi:hypothetical protein
MWWTDEHASSTEDDTPLGGQPVLTMKAKPVKDDRKKKVSPVQDDTNSNELATDPEKEAWWDTSSEDKAKVDAKSESDTLPAGLPQSKGEDEAHPKNEELDQ